MQDWFERLKRHTKCSFEIDKFNLVQESRAHNMLNATVFFAESRQNKIDRSQTVNVAKQD